MVNEKLKEARLLLGVAGYSMKTADKIRAHFGSEQVLLDARVQDLRAAGLGPRTAERLVELRERNAHIDEAKRCEADVLVNGFSGFPAALAEIPDAPAVLFCRGCLPETPRLAVVGARRCTPEGLKLARSFGRAMAEQGVVVVSGLARGIDAAAMGACLQAGGKAIGVLGCGLDRVYPPENAGLFLDTVRSGALVTEFPLRTQPLKPHFPRRNRVISGLALGVLVVEASRKSGSLITVDHALDQGREVLAVPGPVGPTFHVGTNQLIRDGASIALCAEDVMATLNLSIDWAPPAEAPAVEPDAAAVLEACRFQALTLDAMAARCALPVSRVMRIVSRLEVQGRLTRVPGARFLEADQRPRAKK